MSKLSPCLKEKPFFIVGNPRSGTTLLNFILSSHPRLHIPSETGFLPQLTKYAQASLREDQVKEIVGIVRRNRDWKELKVDVNVFYGDLPEKSLACVLDRLYRLKIKEFKAERWGDKTPSYVRFMHQIDQIFPNAQFIHLIRDGRDSALSAQKKWGSQKWYMDNYYLLKNWATNVESGRRVGEKLVPNRYLEIKYEVLVQEPLETIKSICAFLQEEFHPKMMEHSELAQKMVSPTGHTEVLRPINTQSVDRWIEEMTLFEKKVANKLIGETLREFDYSLPICQPLTFMEQVRLFVLGIRYLQLYFLRNILYRTGLLTLNRGKRRRVDNDRKRRSI